MTKKKTPEFRIVVVRRDLWKPFRTTAGWLFRFLLIGIGVGVVVYNQYALSTAVGTVQELKRSLLLNKAELPIKKMLDGRTEGKLSELQKIQLTKLIAGQEIDPSFTLDLIRRESSFDPMAVSSQGAIGLMQVLPSTGRWIAEREGIAWNGGETLFDPVTNVQIGLAYLKYLVPDFRRERLLRAAYQRGPAKVSQRREEDLYGRNP